MPARSSPRDGAPYRRQALYVPVDAAAPNDLQRRARGQRGGRYSRGRPAPRWRCRRRSPGWSATPSAERRRLLGPVVVQPPPPGGAAPRAPRRCAHATRPAPLRRAERRAAQINAVNTMPAVDRRQPRRRPEGLPVRQGPPRPARAHRRDPSRAQPHPDRGGRRCSRLGHSPAQDRRRRSTAVGTSSGNWAH